MIEMYWVTAGVRRYRVDRDGLGNWGIGRGWGNGDGLYSQEYIFGRPPGR